jgi:uncharacterized membrane protein (DUF106 family)
MQALKDASPAFSHKRKKKSLTQNEEKIMRLADLKIQIQKRVHRLMLRSSKLNLYSHCTGYVDMDKIINELDYIARQMDELIDLINKHQYDDKEQAP